MNIIRIKNFIGLCACEGCRKHFKICVELKFKKIGGNIVKPPFYLRRFWLCEDHTWEISHELLKAGGEYENN